MSAASGEVIKGDAGRLDEASDVLQELNNLTDTEESSSGEAQNEDQELDEEVINKELVTWAGRLEMESIDLREKANLLTNQMTQNSQVIKNTAIGLKTEFKSWKDSSTRSLNGAVQSFSKATSNFVNATKVLSSIKDKYKSTSSNEIQNILKLLKSTKSSIEALNETRNTIHNESLKVSNSVLSRKIQTVINSIQKLNNHYTHVEDVQKLNNKSLQTLNDKMTKCLNRIEDIQNLQVDFSKDLKSLGKNQATLSSEFYKLKADVLVTRRTDTQNQITQYTPNSSFSDSMGSFARHQSPLIPSKPPVQVQGEPITFTQEQHSVEQVKIPQKRTRSGQSGSKGVRKIREPTKTFRTRASYLLTENDGLQDQIRTATIKNKALSDVTNKVVPKSPHLQHELNYPHNHTMKIQHPTDEGVISLLSDDNGQSFFSDL